MRRLLTKMRLTSLLAEPGGMTVKEAVAAADANLTGLKAKGVTALRTVAADASAAFQATPAEFDAGALQTLYTIATRAVGCGAVGGEPAADTALISLCELLDAFLASGQCDREAIGVHVDALQLLALSAAGQPTQSEELLDGLKKVTQRFVATR